MSSFDGMNQLMSAIEEDTARPDRERAQAFESLKAKMEELGSVDVEDPTFFSVFKEDNTAGAGVYVRKIGRRVKAKVVVELGHVAYLLPRIPRLGFSASLTVPYIDGPGQFSARVRTAVNSRWHGEAHLAIYEPNEAFDDEVMRKCVSLVAAAFNH
jgi:hypothetical protein